MDFNDLTGPTHAELRAIELEWPLIAAEMDLTDAEIRLLTAPGGPSELDWQRVRSAERRMLGTLRDLLNLTEAASRPVRRVAVAV
jgi:Family of unknown function (DUF6284)